MSRWWIVPVFATAAFAQSALQKAGPKTPAASPGDDQTQLPPEEDKAAIPKEYTFNPLQSQRELQVGEFYFRKGDYRAAAGRFEEATKWNDGNAEAWFRLAETQEKNHEVKAAREAYQKFLQLAPSDRKAGEVRKRLEKIRG